MTTNNAEALLREARELLAHPSKDCRAFAQSVIAALASQPQAAEAGRDAVKVEWKFSRYKMDAHLDGHRWVVNANRDPCGEWALINEIETADAWTRWNLTPPAEARGQEGGAGGISWRENGLLCDMEMFAAGRDLVTGDPITLLDVQRIAARWLATTPAPDEDKQA